MRVLHLVALSIPEKWDAVTHLPLHISGGSLQKGLHCHMTHNSTTKNTMAAKLLEFDTTLKQLYASGRSQHAESPAQVYLFPVMPTAESQLADGLPQSEKYTYQDGALSGDKDFRSRLFTQVMPQWFGMIAGKMPIIMFDLDAVIDGSSGDGGRRQEQARMDVKNVLAQICEAQRPSVLYIKTLADLAMPAATVLASACPIDCIEHLPQITSLEGHYRALSKRELALSGVPTPKSVVVDSTLDWVAARDPHMRKQEVSRMLTAVEQASLPFVLKLPQARGGWGTYVVKTANDKARALTKLRPVVNDMLLGLRASNQHFYPASLIIQTYVKGSDVVISLFVKQDGTYIVTSVTDQVLNEHSQWIGSHIAYDKQAALEEEHRLVGERIAAWMHQLGYWGPIGADIIVDERDGSKYVVDVNARLTASTILGFVKTHALCRCFKEAGIVYATVRGSWHDFRTRFEIEFSQGSIVVVGWSYMEDKDSSIAGILIAGEDFGRWEKLAGEIKSLDTSSTKDELP